MPFNAYIFDLDGTLLNTLPDLVRLTNMVLEERGWPTRTREEILSFVGNGGRNLLGRAAPTGTETSEIDDAFSRWRELYPTYGHALTQPYDGIPELLERLRANGARLGVLSNKFDGAAKHVIEKHFPGMFDIVRGESADTPRKPDPTGLLRMIDELGATIETTVFVGDSTTDIATANAAGVACIGVSWGYQPRESLEAEGAQRIVETPSDI